MANEEWTLERLEMFASNYIINEHSMRNKILTKFDVDNVDQSSSRTPPRRWREFRKHLFAELRRHLRWLVANGLHPMSTLKNVPFSMSKLIQRFDLLNFAVKVEVCVLDGIVCNWAVRHLILQLGRVANQQCRKYGFGPRALLARHLAPAVSALQDTGATLRCTRAQLVDIWQRLCALKTRQLQRLIHEGDVPLAVPLTERLDGHDWQLLDTLLLHDNDNSMQIVTMMTLQSVESYRALVVFARVLALAAIAMQRVLVPLRGRALQQLWSRVHARYAATGRTASVILLQRRWYQLRTLALSGADQPGISQHPLLEYVAAELSPAMKERKDTWFQRVSYDRCVLVGDENIGKQERKRNFYFDFKILEQLQTVDDINEYIKRRLHYCKEKHRCGFWEHSHCSCAELCADNVQGVDRSHSVMLTTVGDDDEAVSNADTCVDVRNATVGGTIEALENLDPHNTRVTVVVEVDSDEEVSALDTGAAELVKHTKSALTYSKIKEVHSKKQTPEENAPSVSGDDWDCVEKETKTESCTDNRLCSVEKQAWLQNIVSGKKGYVSCRLLNYNFCENNESCELNDTNSTTKEATFKDEGTSLNKDSVNNKFYLNEVKCGEETVELNDVNFMNYNVRCNEALCTKIDNKLLHMTHVKLSRIDETLAWKKHARNDSIDLRRSGLLTSNGNSNNFTAKNPNIENDVTAEGVRDSEVTRIMKDTESDVSSLKESIISKNQRLLKLCKAAVVKLTKLEDSDVQRRSRVVKKVELPDIDEVRRINKNILTAQVKPISLNKLKTDSSVRNGESHCASETEFMDLEKDLKLLDKDMRVLFSIPPEERQATINKAIYSDDGKHLTINVGLDLNESHCHSTTPNVFLDNDEDDAAEVNEGNKPAKKKRRKYKKKECIKDKKCTDEPTRLNAFEEWERQKQIANIYFTIGAAIDETEKHKKVKKKSKQSTIDTKKNNEASEELVPNNHNDGNDPKVTVDPQAAGVSKDDDETLKNKSTDSYLIGLLNAPQKDPKTDCLSYLVINPMDTSDRVIEINDDDDHDSVVGAAREESSVVNDSTITPMITSVYSLAHSETVHDNVADVSQINENQTQKMPDSDKAECSENTNSNISSNLTMSVTPSHRTITVQVGDQVVCKTSETNSNVQKVKMSPNPQTADNTEPPATCPPPANQSLLATILSQELQPPASKLKLTMYKPLETNDSQTPLTAAEWMEHNLSNKRLQRVEWNVNRRRKRKKPINDPETDAADTHTQSVARSPHGQAHNGPSAAVATKKKKWGAQRPLSSKELIAEFTTPEEYLRTDHRKLLTVVKFDMSLPIWELNNEYAILTEENLPCDQPGFWTAGREPPGPCQFLVWPKNLRTCTDILNTANDSCQDLGENVGANNSKDFNVITDNPSTGSKLIDTQIVSEINVSKGQLVCHERNNFNENYNSINNIVDTNTENRDIFNNKDDPLETNRNVNVPPNNMCIQSSVHFADDSDSDCDSESNKLQIVEETDIWNDRNTDDNSESERSEPLNCNSSNLIIHKARVDTTERGVDSFNNKIVNKDDLSDTKPTKPEHPESKSSASHTRSLIKVKSFANVGRMEPKPVTLDADGNPNIIEKNNKFYKKLSNAPDAPGAPGAPGSLTPVSTYALMLSAVTCIEQCDRLLRQGAPLHVLERKRGFLYPLDVSGCDPIRIRHHDAQFLNDFATKFVALNASNPLNNQMYLFALLERWLDANHSASGDDQY